MNGVAMTMIATMPYFAITFFLSLSSPPFSTSFGVTAVHTEIANNNNAHPQIPQNCLNSNSTLECEIQEMKFRVARLELLLEEAAIELHTKSLYVEKCEKKIEEMSNTIDHLETVLSNLKDAPDYEEMINAFEEQVRELEAGVWRNDLNLRLLEAKTKDDEKLVEVLTSKIETMASIIPELWFHVQKLEQAHEVIERRTAELRRHIRNQKCSFFKVINNLFGRRYKIIAPYTSEALNQLRRSFSAVKKHHHQLQGFVKRELVKNEFTAILAGEELVFFLASAVVVFPVILALRLFSSVIFLAASIIVFSLVLALR